MIEIIGYITSTTLIAISLLLLTRGYVAAAPILAVALMCLNACLSANQIIYSRFAIFWSEMGAVHNSTQNIAYFVFILVSMTLVFWLANPKSLKTDGARDLLASVGKSRIAAQLSLAVLAVSALHFLSVDTLSIVRSEQYLFLNSFETLRFRNALTELIHTSRNHIGILSFLLFALAIAGRNKRLIFALGLSSTWFLVLALANHSRYAFLFLCVLGFILYFYRRTGAAIISGLFAVLFLLAALYGRSSGVHGLVGIPSSLFGAFATTDFSRIEFAYTNFFEGVYTQAEAFYYTNAEFASIYKTLSFSPFPSFIDGFSANAVHLQIRLHTFVPMGATGEVVVFGWQYLIAYWLAYLYAFFLTIKLLNRGMIYIGIAALVLLLYCTFVQFSYPVRWVFRFYVLIIGMYWFIGFARPFLKGRARALLS